jgi:hypothetical protein
MLIYLHNSEIYSEKRNMIVSCVQTYIYEGMYLHISKKHRDIYSAFEYPCSFGYFDPDRQFLAALIRKA